MMRGNLQIRIKRLGSIVDERFMTFKHQEIDGQNIYE